ncbi:MAG: hypothetical protein WBP81_08010 [Solirubrobacteraceae bacterium]
MPDSLSPWREPGHLLMLDEIVGEQLDDLVDVAAVDPVVERRAEAA